MTGGAPQGSRLGPKLWNSAYDEVLDLPMQDGVVIYGFADDTVVVCWSTATDDLEQKVNNSLKTIENCLERKGLKLAAHKTEAVLITDRRNFSMPRITVGGVEVQWKQHIRYLGVELDHKLSFGPQAIEATKKALDKAGSMARITPNVGGPSEYKRRLICSVALSSMMYAAPVWGDALQKKNILKKVISEQRTLALRVICGYRTVSACAAMVLASVPPADLMAEERKTIYTRMRAHGDEQTEGVTKETIRREAREETIKRWQQRYNGEQTGRWTHTLLPDLKRWTTREHGQMRYYLTQALTGHGCFRSYLKRFKLTDDNICEYCETEEDNVEHTLFRCTNWQHLREHANEELGYLLTKENLGDTLLKSQEHWSIVEHLVNSILKIKEDDEFEKKRRRRQDLDHTRQPEDR